MMVKHDAIAPAVGVFSEIAMEIISGLVAIINLEHLA